MDKHAERASIRKIMGYNAKARLWLLAVSEALGLILIVFFYYLILFGLATGLSVDMYNSQADCVRYEMTNYFKFLPMMSGIVAMIMGFLCAFSGFYHYHFSAKPKWVPFGPIKRSLMFWTVYWNGLLIWLVTALFNSLLLILLTFNLFHSIKLTLLYAMLKALLVSLCVFCLIYHFSLLCIMISENSLIALIAIISFGLFPVFFYILAFVFVYNFIPSFPIETFSFDFFNYFSPIWNTLSFLINSVKETQPHDMIHKFFFQYTPVFLQIFLCFVLAKRLYITNYVHSF
jgi:hypothetical protein